MDIVEHICNDQAKRNQTEYCTCKQNMRQPTKEEAMPKFPVNSVVFLAYKSFDDKDRAELFAVSFPGYKDLFNDLTAYIDSVVRRYKKEYDLSIELIDPNAIGRNYNDFLLIHIGKDVKVVISVDVISSVQNLTNTDGHMRATDLKKWDVDSYNLLAERIIGYFNLKAHSTVSTKSNEVAKETAKIVDYGKAACEISTNLVKISKDLENLAKAIKEGI